MSAPAAFGWLTIVRLGLIQAALGSVVVLTNSTLNRIMVVELALPAMLAGGLVGLHYAVQMLRPRWGYGSDVGGRRTPWIVGGMALLAVGGWGAAFATVLMATDPAAGIALAVVAYAAIGSGVGACGTSLLALLATRVPEGRRAAAATVVWVMMIAGIAVTATAAGAVLDPYSPDRLLAVAAGIGAAAFLVTLLAVWRVEGARPARPAAAGPEKPRFLAALGEVWVEPEARRFTVFVFASMLAYSAQDLVLEPFAGLLFQMTPGESTRLAGLQHAGVLVGMIAVAVAGTVFRGRAAGSLTGWTCAGCVASAAALAALASGAFLAPDFPLRPTVFVLGVANGAFAVAAIGSMMALAGKGRARREGTRMGLWGAAQAIAFGLGGFLGTVVVDAVQAAGGAPAAAYASVFAGEAVLFLGSAGLILRVSRAAQPAAGTLVPRLGGSIAT